MYCELLINRINQFYRQFIDVRKNGKPLILGDIPKPSSIILTGNDYLAIANHPEIISAQTQELNNNSKVVMSAAFLHGNSLQRTFECEMAEFLGYEAAILCQSGWAGNVGLMQAISGQNIPVYIDFYTHMSLWEGIKSAGATARPFLHNNCRHLEKLIKRYGSGVIVVDSLYSTIGDICPLEQMAQIAKKYGCIFVVDESHSVGTHGIEGSGLVKQLGLEKEVDFITLSLAKSFVGRAGLITCSSRFAGYFPYISYPAIFSSSILDYEIAGLRTTLKIIKESDERRKILAKNSEYLREALKDLGYVIASQSQIIALETGTDERTEIIRDEIEKQNIFGSVFCAPATANNKAIIRLSINSNISKWQLNHIITSCKNIKNI
jgi:7-keto-8-aminopelargonate synthetase-like enzyme